MVAISVVRAFLSSSMIFSMSWIDWLEARLGFLGIPRLVQMIALLTGLVYALHLFRPDYVQLLTLQPSLVLQGQVWRLVSYIFIPEVVFQYFPGGTQLLFLVLYLWFLVWIGDALEQAWGSFRLTLYYLLGMLGVTIAAFFLGGDLGTTSTTPFFINISLFYAFATIFPDVQIYVLFVLPLRVKWVALLSFAPLLFTFLFSPLATKAAIVISLLNYLLFFGPAAFNRARNRSETRKRRVQFAAKSVPEDEPLHRCVVCHRTERDPGDLDFRVSGDGQEYCLEHLPNAVDR
jgi:hypothetical protein